MTDVKQNKLAARAFDPLPLGSIRPAGWLRSQLRIQADGLSGHLDEFWPDVAKSGWIGGASEGWERGPYWLDGVVPLAYLLDDARLKAKVQRWMEYILTHQHEDGWLGPINDPKYGYPYDPWPVFITLKAMTQYQEATGDPRVIPVMERFLRKLDTLLDEQPLQMWAKMRWPDLLVSVDWLYERTGDDWLLAFAEKIHAQGYDWRNHFTDFQYKEKHPQWTLEAHVVNNAMALKHSGLWYRHSHDAADKAAVIQEIAILDQYHGQATGVFTGDETLAGLNPSQGTELCAVVEYMYSLELLISALGDVALADRLERITFNALPATFKPDMWAHQYVQQANQVVCKVSPEHLYTNNGPDANLYGLEPNYGCCTANMHQGWPKFAAHLWMQTPDDGLAAVAYAPCQVATQVNGVAVAIDVQTDYPFRDTVQIRVNPVRPSRFPIYLRIPQWTRGATFIIGDQSLEVQAGTFAKVEQDWQPDTIIRLHLPTHTTIQRRYQQAVSIERGPLIYALEIGEDWKHLSGDLPHADWEVYPTTSWNYALKLDPANPDASLTFEPQPMGDSPFSPEGAPIRCKAQGSRVPSWAMAYNAAEPPPSSPVTTAEPLEALTLISYGCTNLRVTEFPVLR
ncbi:MAG: glycoside hydrolase family 127 protein [Anaerolineae bacterium]|nr:glycoside hydrolase family 127 protein [Anaerolineae bacterium]